jgi:hypothetical protein
MLQFGRKRALEQLPPPLQLSFYCSYRRTEGKRIIPVTWWCHARGHSASSSAPPFPLAKKSAAWYGLSVRPDLAKGRIGVRPFGPIPQRTRKTAELYYTPVVHQVR